MAAPQAARGSRRMTQWGMVFVMLIGASASAVLGAKKPAADDGAMKPTTEPAAPADPKRAAEAVKTAIVNLTKETAAHAKDPKSPLRGKSNYFLENKSPDVTPEEILTAMGRNLASDSSADAYIKWQLLSGIRSKVDAKLSPKLVAIYRFAPAPLTRPGLDPADKKQLDRGLRGMGEKDVSRINSELQARVDEVEKANAPILAYRDDLYARLPASGDAILGGLEDAAARAGRGIDGGSHMKGVLAQITTWCVSASPSEIKAVGALLRGLVGKMNPPGKNAKAAFPPNYYAAAEYDSKAKRLTWKDGAAKFPDVKAINALIQQLDEVAASLANMKGK